MVELRSIQIDEVSFIGVYLNLPHYPLHLIVSTHTILAQNAFSIAFFEHENKRAAVILCQYVFGFEGLLNSKVIEYNTYAEKKGVMKGMCGKEAMMLCEKN